MRPRALLLALVAIALAVVCARLGVWQQSRWLEKRRLHEAARLARAGAPVELRSAGDVPGAADARVVLAIGTFDPAWHLLISDRWWKDRPGVEVLTPMRMRDGGALLVDRGWLSAEDAITARPQEHGEPGERGVTGVLVAVRSPARAHAWSRLGGGDTVVWSARALDLDSVRARLGYSIAPLVLRALPGPDAPSSPLRLPPEPDAEGMHLAYAVQWYLFAASLAAGAVLVLWRDRAGRKPPAAA